MPFALSDFHLQCLTILHTKPNYLALHHCDDVYFSINKPNSLTLQHSDAIVISVHVKQCHTIGVKHGNPIGVVHANCDPINVQ